MSVSAGYLARQNHLHARVQGVSDRGHAGHAGILENQHSPLCLLGGDQLTGLQQERSDLTLVVPLVWDRGRCRHGGDQTMKGLPQRCQVALAKASIIALPGGGEGSWSRWAISFRHDG